MANLWTKKGKILEETYWSGLWGDIYCLWWVLIVAEWLRNCQLRYILHINFLFWGAFCFSFMVLHWVVVKRQKSWVGSFQTKLGAYKYTRLYSLGVVRELYYLRNDKREKGSVYFFFLQVSNILSIVWDHVTYDFNNTWMNLNCPTFGVMAALFFGFSFLGWILLLVLPLQCSASLP